MASAPAPLHRDGLDPIERVLERLSVYRRNASGYVARCPAHEDRRASLSIRCGQDGKVLLKCFAGCSIEAIAAALGLELRDLFPAPNPRLRPVCHQPRTRRDPPISLASLSQNKRIPVEFLQGLGLRDATGKGVEIPYLDLDGRVMATKIRRAIIAKDGSYWPKATALMPYGLWRLADATGKFLVLVEGESDCWTLWFSGFPALGLPGASTAHILAHEHVQNVPRLYIVQEPDQGGAAFVQGIRRQLQALNWSGETYVVRFEGAKDPSDLYRESPANFKNCMQAALDHAQPLEEEESLELPTDTSTPDEVHLTDLGNAKRLIARHGNDIRYCHIWGKWLIWNAARWQLDETGEITRRAKETITHLYAQAALDEDTESRKATVRHALHSENESRLRAMVTLAESEPGIPIVPHQFDANPWLLNCRNGVLDLRTGRLDAHQREHHCSKLVPVDYREAATCPHWDAFLEKIMDGDQQLIRFLQRIIGYTLTGDTREQCLFLFYGTGANGKSTFLETIRALLGDYSQQADFSTFLARPQNEGARNDVARLIGSRFVSAIEAGDGRRLAEVLVKQLTGGDVITARFLYREHFEFRPQFKIFLAANHKPIIRGTDHAIWRRIRLIPFTVTIPDEDQDRTLPAKLRAELSGILRWAVGGCLAWQQSGLDMPGSVQLATREYRQEMDTLAGFLDECCIQAPDAKATPKSLYTAYTQWCERNGEKALTQRALSIRLTERGFVPGRTGYARFWQGIGLVEPSFVA